MYLSIEHLTIIFITEMSQVVKSYEKGHILTKQRNY